MKNKIIVLIAKVIAVVIGVIVAVLIGIPVFMYSYYGEDTYYFKMNDEITNSNFWEERFEAYTLNGVTVRPIINYIDKGKFSLEIDAYSKTPSRLTIIETVVTDFKSKAILYDSKREVELRTQNKAQRNYCFDYKDHGQFAVGKGMLDNSIILSVQLKTISVNSNEESESKPMVFILYGNKTRVLDTP